MEATLTLPGVLPYPARSRELMQYAAKCWRTLRKRVHARAAVRGTPRPEFVRIVEYQARGAPHYHLIVFGDVFVGCATKADREAFLVSCGFGFKHTWEAVRDRRKMANYLTKYVTKACSERLPRFCNRYSSSRGFIPNLDAWVALRALFPEATTHERASVTIRAEEGDGFRMLEFDERWWTTARWRTWRVAREDWLVNGPGCELARAPPESVRFVTQLVPS